MGWLDIPERPHVCKWPGRRERKAWKCQVGARWQCGDPGNMEDGCGQIWIWKASCYDGPEWHREQLPPGPPPKSPSGVSPRV